ncbi:maleylpyruvate isomerase N-terminal domain-containing protein [Luedemannella flava]
MATLLDAVLDLGDQLTDEQWAGGTECPEWSVGDVYAHLIGTELWMIAGHPRPESYQTWSRRPVVARRDMPREEILDELRDVYAQRRAQLRAYPPDPAARPSPRRASRSRWASCWRCGRSTRGCTSRTSAARPATGATWTRRARSSPATCSWARCRGSWPATRRLSPARCCA